jgi:hypothetical protein
MMIFCKTPISPIAPIIFLRITWKNHTGLFIPAVTRLYLPHTPQRINQYVTANTDNHYQNQNNNQCWFRFFPSKSSAQHSAEMRSN